MRFFTRLSVIVFALLLGPLLAQGTKANAEETGDHASLAMEPAAVPVDVSSLANPGDTVADTELPDDPASQQSAMPSDAKPANTTAPNPNQSQGKQTKRILFVVPNFRAVSADQHLPPQTVKQKFKTAALDSFDYSAFIFVAGQAAVAQANKSYPEFRQGAAGYGRYYWHTLADEVNENTWVEFIVPSLLHQDTRYYTLGRGNFGKRLAYAFSRVAITRTDSGKETFNASEFAGAFAFAGTANLYYPSQERTFTKTYQRYIENLAIDSCVMAFKEVWPDINNAIFHQKD